MAIKRKQVGDAERYQGRRLHAKFMGPDLLGYVDDVELSGFFLTVEAAIAAGRRYVDDEAREKAKREANGRSTKSGAA